MICYYISPRQWITPNRTRNLLAEYVRYPDTFEEIVHPGRFYGVCRVNAPQSVHDAIAADARISAISQRIADNAAAQAWLTTRFNDMPGVDAVKAKLESNGISTSWIKTNHSVKNVYRYLLSQCLVAQRAGAQIGEIKIGEDRF